MIRKLTLKKERTHEENDASVAGNVMRDLIAHVTNDNLIGRKIKSGELRKKMVEPPWKCPDMFTLTTIEMEHFTMEWLELSIEYRPLHTRSFTICEYDRDSTSKCELSFSNRNHASAEISSAATGFPR